MPETLNAPSSESFVLGFYTQGLLTAFTELGGELQALGRVSQQDIGSLAGSQSKVPAQDYLALMASANALISKPGLGLAIGPAMQISSFAQLGTAIAQAETLGQATEQVLALESVVHRLGHSQVIREAGSVRFVWHNHFQHHAQAQTLTESVLSGIVFMAQSLAARGVPVLEASFIHPEPPGQLAAYRRCFRSRCYFSQPSNSLLLAEDVLAWPVQQANMLAGVRSVNAGRKFSLASLQQFLVLALTRGDFQLEQAAAYFHLSSRTLQRRLSQQGLAYQPLLKQQRLRLAEDYLLYSDMGLQEISQLLGFKEQSSFNHFFIAARNMTPSTFRQKK